MHVKIAINHIVVSFYNGAGLLHLTVWINGQLCFDISEAEQQVIPIVDWTRCNYVTLKAQTLCCGPMSVINTDDASSA